jgi:hypothetical protein
VTNVCIKFISSNQIHIYTANCVSQLERVVWCFFYCPYEQTSTNVSTDTRTTHTSHHDSSSSFKVYTLKLMKFHVILRCYSRSAVKQLLMFWKITAPVILVTMTVQHTQTEHHIMAIHGLTWHFPQHKTFHSESSHIQWDETSTAVNQNQCGVCFLHGLFLHQSL